MVLLFVGVKRPLYKRDVLNACCEPIDARINLGYNFKWVPDNLRSGERLQKQIALIIYCELNVSPKPIFIYHPIRLAKIIDASPEFGSLTLDLQLGSFFDYEKYGGQIGTFIKDFQDYITKSNEQPEQTEFPRWIREDKEWDKSDFSDNWTPFVNHMRVLSGLKDSIFFSIQRTSNSVDTPCFLFDGSKYENRKVTCKVGSGKSYDISIYMLMGDEASHASPELVMKETVASISGPFLSQRSAGIEADFVINFKRSFERDTCRILIRIPPEQPNKVISPEFQALLKITPPRSVLVMAVTFLTLGAAIISIGTDLVKETAAWFADPHAEWLRNNLLLVVFIAKTFGALLLAAGSYIGFRKLPLKTS